MPTRRTFLNAKWNFRLTTEAYSIISMMFSMEQETSIMGAAKSIDRVKTKDALAGKRKLIQVFEGGDKSSPFNASPKMMHISTF